ncbi:MAG: hypothetical protein A2284_02730 [Deltaproteobacteria bacterium RIFOXYA12_FULL_61_11]|nr:MAG: hypothetical protein A2284_02730 [Deltaproteobacteria bacterium RIFOXYA12_FULL_61_11]
MIEGAFLHLPGIGPATAQRLRAAGFLTWSDVLAHPERLPLGPAGKEKLLAAVERNRQALEADNLHYLVSSFHPKEHWRLLGGCNERLSYFDLETDGLWPYGRITLIVCLHRGRLWLFRADRDLDAFLDLLEEVDLLVSFNGTCFDVPMVLQHYHIPELPCAHLDLRWVCHHLGWKGGLKAIEQAVGLQRPPGIFGLDGEDAILLWQRWIHRRDRQAFTTLVRYCAADVLSLRLLTTVILAEHGTCLAEALGPNPYEQLDDLLLEPLEEPRSTP